MNTKVKNAIKFLTLYIVQVGTLWGLLEGYSYFMGDALKNLLGSFWILIYIIPLFTTLYIFMKGVSEETDVKESISTEGKYSPGKVRGDYSVRQQFEDNKRSTPSNEIFDEKRQDIQTAKPIKSIQTKGDFSPGEVEGDYKIEE